MSDAPSSRPNLAPHDASDTASTGVDRRSFLKISSAAAVVAVAAPSLAEDKKQYASPKARGDANDLKGGWFVV